MKTLTKTGQTKRSYPLLQYVTPAIVLFAFWVILSGKFDGFHLTIGGVVVLATIWGTTWLYRLGPPIGPTDRHPLATPPSPILYYLPWLSWQIVIASVQVARVVLDPKLPIQPRFVRFTHRLPHNMARLTLANSITLTPGTVTINVDGDEYLVHALTLNAAEAYEPSGKIRIKEKVSMIYERDRSP